MPWILLTNSLPMGILHPSTEVRSAYQRLAQNGTEIPNIWWVKTAFKHWTTGVDIIYTNVCINRQVCWNVGMYIAYMHMYINTSWYIHTCSTYYHSRQLSFFAVPGETETTTLKAFLQNHDHVLGHDLHKRKFPWQSMCLYVLIGDWLLHMLVRSLQSMRHMYKLRQWTWSLTMVPLRFNLIYTQ